MKLNCYQDSSITENHVDIYYNEKDIEITGIIDYIHSLDTIVGKKNDISVRIMPNEIFYCETVERRCYAYLKKDVYRIELSLNQFLERFAQYGFIQISKSMLVNVFKISQFKTDLNMKMKLYMENGEILILNRAYKKNFMDYLRKMQEDTP